MRTLTKSRLTSVILAISMLALLALPLIVSAAVQVPTEPAGFAENFFGCTGTPTITCIIDGVIQFLLAIVFLVAVVFLIIGGFRYIVSQGNEEGVEKAKGTITNAIIGIVVVLLGWIILRVVINILEKGAGTVT